MSTDEFEEQRRLFIVDEETYDKERVKTAIDKLARFAKISNSGRVYIDRSLEKGLTLKNKIVLVIVARYLGNKLNQDISSEITAKDISTYISADLPTVHARGKELADDGYVSKPTDGTYVMNPGKIDEFLDSLKLPEK